MEGNPIESESLTGNVRGSLLSRQYHIVCPAAILTYIALQLLIGLQSGIGEPADNVGKGVYDFYCSGGTSFSISAIQQLIKIFECRLQSGIFRSSAAIFVAVFTVNVIAGSAFFLTYLMKYGGISTDVFGVVSTTPQWAEWLVSVPLMVYVTLAIEDKPALTKRDKIVLGVFTCAIACGFLLNFREIGQPVGFVLFILGCCSITVNLFLDRAAYAIEFDVDVMDEITRGSTVGSMSVASKQKTLNRLFLLAFPFFPATHIAGHLKLLTRDQVLIGFGMCSLVSKLLFAGSLYDTHTVFAHSSKVLRKKPGNLSNATTRENSQIVLESN